VSRLYLIRHGQAGTRHNYDVLSDLGREQARRLGDYLAAQNVVFSAVVSGGLARQRQTAEEVCAAYLRAGVATPDIVVAPGWNEFDLFAVFRDLAPQLAAEDPEFARDYQALLQEMSRAMSQARQEESLTDTRRASPDELRCAIAVVRAWAEDRLRHSSETWPAFRERITGCLDMVAGYRPGEAVAVFTSATPIAVWVGLAMGVRDGSLLRQAGVAYNTGITTLRVRERDLTLFSFNNVPHLPEPRLRTFR